MTRDATGGGGSRPEAGAPPLLITIDGPSGAGKTTVSRSLAQRLGYRYIDTGAMYRAMADAALSAGIDTTDPRALESLCRGLQLVFVATAQGTRLEVNGRDVTTRLRSPEVSMTASAVSAQPVVRRHLLGVQRELGRRKAAVFEGRDMGTVVFPEADVKFFLDASLDVRSRRRFAELPGGGQDLDQVRAQMHRRDHNDRTRRVAPLKPAVDAIAIDATELTIDEVVERMLAHVRSAGFCRR